MISFKTPFSLRFFFILLEKKGELNGDAVFKEFVLVVPVQPTS